MVDLDLLVCVYLLGKARDVCREEPRDFLDQQHHVVLRQQLRQALQTPLNQPPNVQVKNRRLGPVTVVTVTIQQLRRVTAGLVLRLELIFQQALSSWHFHFQQSGRHMMGLLLQYHVVHR